MDQAAGELTPRERMGRTIRTIRHRRKLTLVQLAASTGLSHSFLSQVERGLAQPSMTSLHRIAEALNATQDLLIAGANDAFDGPEVAVLRAGEGVPIPMVDTSKGSARQLPSSPGFFPTEYTWIDKEFGQFFAHAGNEFLYLAEGMIEVDLGKATYVLEPGDCVRYPGRLPHRFRGLGRDRTRVLMVHTGVSAHPIGTPQEAP
ncbi:MAG TPA: XRE family transcriptional regulator [Amycolatopsis sp.]|uniref:helix-turn-helix domain-containing protein n=1 Tax=Amycolatopsis sp. TaxID=37632 RepID=UPI002B46D795|nr:XRE family transcriptional regulator [Amycolatopsis sp.]HKS44864.1 XRE family transcriptional regulator [Amycolatopsis sp.]